MAIGERIRFLRNLRNMTQKYLGMTLGFPEKSADVRLAQYESGTRTPKEDLIKELASILDVSPSALTVPDIDSYVGVMHTLFALEDLYGIRIVKTDGNPHIVIDALASPSARELRTHLCDWMEVSGKYHNGEISKEAYDDWRYHYPAGASGYVKLPE
ncbi:MAG: helix-turn-helix transcriptional regulator [Oscillospiraceae bacterium]|nr:helix-turn-helix transcriptional regulator [Oscillospiraceae bacterium]